MKKERAPESVEFFAYERVSRRFEQGFSPIFVTAALSVLVLIAAVGWEMNQSLAATGTVAAHIPLVDGRGNEFVTADSSSESGTFATSSDPISAIGAAVLNQLESAYAQMQQAGVYSSSTAQAVGASLAPYVSAQVSYQIFSASALKTDRDTSYARMLQYRSDLRNAFVPLLKNTEPEYEIFARYVDTNDASYLVRLRDIAQDYRVAASSTALVVVPSDAVQYHLGILNAMEEMAATLDAMATHASDPFASVALLRGYNQAESDMLTAFNALTTYYKSKKS